MIKIQSNLLSLGGLGVVVRTVGVKHRGLIKQNPSFVMHVKNRTSYEARGFEENSQIGNLNQRLMKICVRNCIPLPSQNQLQNMKSLESLDLTYSKMFSLSLVNSLHNFSKLLQPPFHCKKQVVAPEIHNQRNKLEFDPSSWAFEKFDQHSPIHFLVH